MRAPVVLIIFNRPHLTLRVLEQISKAKPSKLFVISDGPRVNSYTDHDRVADCRRLIDLIDWPCQVLKKYSEVNLGCKENIVLGLDWVFNQVDEAIILEDDCVPNSDFFVFCDEMLETYRDNLKVGSICGTNLGIFDDTSSQDSFFFSKFPSVWGWATWRRVWTNYEKDLSKWSSRERRKIIKANVRNIKSRRYWTLHFSSVAKNRVDTWDYQLTFLHFRKKLLSIIPSVNLISNIGFGIGATHTFDTNHRNANLQTSSMEIPISIPISQRNNEEYDALLEKHHQGITFLRFVAETIFVLLPSRVKVLVYRLFRGI